MKQNKGGLKEKKREGSSFMVSKSTKELFELLYQFDKAFSGNQVNS